MARTKGSKNKTKNTTISLEPMIPPVTKVEKIVKKDKGAALKEYWDNKKAEKLSKLQSLDVKTVLEDPKRPAITADQKDEHLIRKNEKQENTTLMMIKKILRTNNPQKCYLVIEF